MSSADENPFGAAPTGWRAAVDDGRKAMRNELEEIIVDHLVLRYRKLKADNRPPAEVSEVARALSDLVGPTKAWELMRS